MFSITEGSMMNKKKYYALDGVRAFACIGIVMMHVLANGNYNLNGFFFNRMIPSFTNLVFLFMAISAFGMCCGYYDGFLDGKFDIVSFYSKRYKKILPFFTLLCLLDFIAEPKITSLYEIIANITLCFGLIPNANITVVGVGWFLGVVFTFYLLFPFFCSLLSSKKKAWSVLAISYLMNYLCRIYFNAGRNSIVFCFVFFVAGGIIFLYRDNIVKIKGITVVSLLFVAISGVLYYFVAYKILVTLIFSCSVIIFSISLKEKNFLNNKVIRFIGSVSFEVYLCHMFIYKCAEKVNLLRIFSSDYFNYFVATLMVFCGAVLFAFVGQRTINMFLNMQMKHLIQEGEYDKK